MEKRRAFTNHSGDPLLLFIEPEAQDYWMLPGETFNLVAEVESSVDDFDIKTVENGFQIWPSNGMGYISVWGNGGELKCGNQRPVDWLH